MLEMLREEFEKKEALHNELVAKYNDKIESKKKVETEMIEIEKEIIHNQGAMQLLNDLAEKIMKDESAQEVITAEPNAEIITTEA